MQTFLIIVGLVLLALAIAIMTRPDTFRVERTASINAPADVPFGYVNDFRRWTAWSPWEKVDPQMQRTFSGAASGVGTSYAWTSTKAGAGHMSITESRPERIALDLVFTKPFKAENLTEFFFEPDNQGTRVRWVMSGRNNTISKAMSLAMSMDRMVGKDFEKGLANLKAAAEADAASAGRGERSV